MRFKKKIYVDKKKKKYDDSLFRIEFLLRVFLKIYSRVCLCIEHNRTSKGQLECTFAVFPLLECKIKFSKLPLVSKRLYVIFFFYPK